MRKILLITSSPREGSYSTQIARSLAQKLAGSVPPAEIVARDLTHDALPHIDDTFAAARNASTEALTDAQRAALVRSDALLEELFSADTIIIAAGMINFGIPSTLKAYIDYIVRPGVTFKYGEKGPEGLLTGKKVYLVLARGGIYSQGPMQSFNFQDPYLKASLGFIGLTDVDVITVEGVAYGPSAAQQALAGAMARVEAIAAA
jgi:FMN-dependent NADH-azoreductase